jgi:predicted dehydrogenase
MAKHKIRVGIIGANPDRGWALTAHIPALQKLPDFEITAVSTSNPETAARAADRFGVRHAFSDYRQLVEHPEVDLVVVAVKAQAHHALAGAAIDAGKHIYCEWPLGRTLAEAEDLTRRAKSAGVHAVVGLQARVNPGVLQLQRLLEEQPIGRILSSSVIASGAGWGPSVAAANLYSMDADSGATMLRVPIGHFLEGFEVSLGDFRSVSALMAVLQPDVTVIESANKVTKTAADQVIISGSIGAEIQLAMASIHYRSGISGATNFHWELNGTKGDILIKGNSGHLQMAELALYTARPKEALTQVPISDEFRWASKWGVPTGPAFNVAQSYAWLAEDLQSGLSRLATFEDALRRHRVIDAIEEAARTGTRQWIEPR